MSSSVVHTEWAAAFRASSQDPRFPFCYHIPASSRGAGPQNLLVLIHGSERAAMAYRDNFVEFAEANDCALLAPLFPVSPLGDGNGDGYKYLVEGDIRYDRVLLAMVAELEVLSGATFAEFGLFGFSGGGHFAHRFFYLHPHRLKALSIGAPGGVTVMDQAKKWSLGTADIEPLFGAPLDIEAMCRVPVQMVIGEDDTRDLVANPASPYYEPGLAATGANRRLRLQSLDRNYRNHGIDVQFEVVPEAAHEWLKMTDAVKGFFKPKFAKQVVIDPVVFSTP